MKTIWGQGLVVFKVFYSILAWQVKKDFLEDGLLRSEANETLLPEERLESKSLLVCCHCSKGTENSEDSI